AVVEAVSRSPKLAPAPMLRVALEEPASVSRRQNSARIREILADARQLPLVHESADGGDILRHDRLPPRDRRSFEQREDDRAERETCRRDELSSWRRGQALEDDDQRAEERERREAEDADAHEDDADEAQREKGQEEEGVERRHREREARRRVEGGADARRGRPRGGETRHDHAESDPDRADEDMPSARQGVGDRSLADPGARLEEDRNKWQHEAEGDDASRRRQDLRVPLPFEP